MHEHNQRIACGKKRPQQAQSASVSIPLFCLATAATGNICKVLERKYITRVHENILSVMRLFGESRIRESRATEEPCVSPQG